MKNKIYKYSAITLVTTMLIAVSMSCEREFDSQIPASFPSDGDVFIDGFTAGLAYEAWGDVTAFDVDKDVKYKGEASMRFAVPDEGQTGGYAGGRFVTSIPRDLSGYDALTFWAKATKAATIDVIGFGNNNEGSKYLASLNGTKINTNWKKIIIPIPDASKLKRESGMLYYSEAPEDGSGYTFWIDEVKFEKLGTIAHAMPAIMDGMDKKNSVFNGVNIPIVGLSFMANLPDGVNQNVVVAPSYFTFSSSNESVATVNDNGLVTVTGEGTALITARLAEENAKGSLTVESVGEFESAPTPTISADSVISIFSDHYQNVPVDYYNGYWQPYQTTLSADFKVGDDNILNYTNFNFVGIQFTSPTINGADMTHLHLDIFVPNDVNPGDKLGIKLIDLGNDGSFEDPNAEVSYTIEGSEMVGKNWISVDISLSGLGPKANLAQIVFENLGSSLAGFYADNIYLYNSGKGDTGENQPNVAAPVPTRNQADVISIYSDSYTNLEGTDYPDWGQATVVSDVSIEGNNTLKFAGLNYQGIQLANNLDASQMDYLHIDFWTKNSTTLNAYLISPGSVEKAYALTVPTSGWTSIDIPLSAFSPVDLADIFQFKFDGNGDIYLDNIYFYKDGGTSATEPTIAAPTPPARDAANVISIYGDSYTNLEGTDYPDWGQTTFVSDVLIQDNNTLKFAGLNYQGIQLASNVNVSGMNYLHIDFWTGNSSTLNAYLISPGPVEKAYALTVPTSGWTSIDIPLSAFSPVDLANIFQFKFDGNGDIYLDNIYFYKDGGTSATAPTIAAPVPPARGAANVISVFSDAYTNVDGTNFDPDWGQSTDATTVDIAGNSTLKYANFNYQGTELGSAQDASGMQYLHIDMWTADATEVKVTPINASGSPTEFLVALTPISAGQWQSYDIPLSGFTGSGMSLNEIIQLKFDGQSGKTPSNIWLDNIYFYKEGGAVATAPTTPAPTPPSRDAANVISVFSDAYTNVDGTNFDPDWGQSTDATTVDIAGNSTLKYANFNYQGTELGSAQDASGMQYLHIDMWTADATEVKVTPINASGTPTEFLVALTPISAGQWQSYDIPLSGFTGSGMSLNEIIQLKFDGQSGKTPSNIWLDNIYFYKEGGSAATAFPIDFEDGSALTGAFDGGANGLNADNPDKSGINTSSKVYQFNKTVGSAWYSGMYHIFDQNIDLTKGTTFKIKIWSPKSNVKVRFQIEKEGGGGNPVTYQIDQTVAQANTWSELTYVFSSVLNTADGYDKIVIFPDFDEANQNPVATEAIYFIDDISQQ